MTDLVEVRCPFNITAKSGFYHDGKKVEAGEQYACNRLCVKVYPPSSGQAYCPNCKLTYTFDVDGQAHVTSSIKVKSVE